MSAFELMATDVASTGVTHNQQPMELVRASLADVLPASQLPHVPDGTRVRIAGIITHRQRPRTASGLTFLGVEDETGLMNVMVSPGLWSRQKVLARTAREALEHPEMQAMLETVLAYPGLPRTYRKMDPRQPLLPMVPTHLRFGGHDLRLFTMLATFGTPLDVTTDEVRVELFFPADASSRALLDALSQGPSAPPA